MQADEAFDMNIPNSDKQYVVAVLRQDGSKYGIAGNAFLFRKDDDGCLWFTCHHVVAELDSILVGHHYQDKENWSTVIPASYVEHLSSPMNDIAVIRTDTTGFEEFAVLPISAIGSESWELSGKAFVSRFVSTEPDGTYFTCKKEMQPVHSYNKITLFDASKENETGYTERVSKFANPWNVPIVMAEIQGFAFMDASITIEPGFSGAPLCFKHNQTQELVCVGMINTRFRKDRSGNDRRSGLAIAYEELWAAARMAIPFYKFSDFVVVVIAATQSEMISHQATFAKFEESHREPLASYYDPFSRDGWKCLGNKSPASLLAHIQQTQYRWQLATLYFDDNPELLTRMLDDLNAPVLFIIDSCSINVENLNNHVINADDLYHHAVYLFPISQDRFSDEFSKKLKGDREKMMHKVWSRSRARDRREVCYLEDDFEKRFKQLLRQAVDHIVRNDRSFEVNQKLPMESIFSNRSQPTLRTGG